MNSLAVRVREAAALSPTLRRFTLERTDGERFPAAEAGAHGVLSLLAGERTHRRAYSLAGLPSDRSHVQIIVRRVAGSRGGSAFLHESVGEGAILSLGLPQNLFPVPKLARSHLLLAAGIGVTPFLAYLPALARAGVPVRLHQVSRADEMAVFAALLAPHADRVTLHSRPNPAGLRALLADQPVGAHVSVCGPQTFMNAVAAAALACGFPPAKVHRESFGGAAPGRSFVAVLARTARKIAVDGDMSLLEALEQAGLDPPSLCRGGVCGQCQVAVLAGTPEHRDHVLSPEERARGDSLMTCVSRASSAELVLDL